MRRITNVSCCRQAATVCVEKKKNIRANKMMHHWLTQDTNMWAGLFAILQRVLCVGRLSPFMSLTQRVYFYLQQKQLVLTKRSDWTRAAPLVLIDALPLLAPHRCSDLISAASKPNRVVWRGGGGPHIINRPGPTVWRRVVFRLLSDCLAAAAGLRQKLNPESTVDCQLQDHKASYWNWTGSCNTVQ